MDLEQIFELLKAIDARLEKLDDRLIEVISQQKIHTHVLSEHERRSTALEERFKPIEQTYTAFTKLLMVVVTLSGCLAGLAALWRVLH